MTLLQAKMPADKDTEEMIYVINVMMEIMGTSLLPNKSNQQFFETYWKSMDDDRAETFRFAYAAIFDKINAKGEMGVLTEMFPMDGQIEDLFERIQTGLKTIEKEQKKKLEEPPTAPGRERFYEEIIPETSADTNGTNNDQQQGGTPNPNGTTDPLQETQTTNGDNLEPPPRNESATGNEMSIAELFNRLTLQSQRNNEELQQKLQQSAKEETNTIKKEIKDMKAGVDNEFIRVREEVKDLKEETARMVEKKNKEIKDAFTQQTQDLQAQINLLKENKKNDDATEREVQVIGLVNPALSQPSSSLLQLPRQEVSKQLQEYIVCSSEDKKVINTVEWLLKECTTNPKVRKLDALKPILSIISTRETVIRAIFNLKQQSVTTEGSVFWDKNEGRHSKSGSIAVDILTKSITSISKLCSNLHQNPLCDFDFIRVLQLT